VSLTLTLCIVFVSIMLLLSVLLYMLPTEGLPETNYSSGVPATTTPVFTTSKPVKAVVTQGPGPGETGKQLAQSAWDGDTIHFIHIPKCGGTTMTTLLRQIQCAADPARNADCCLNPGFCDWHAHRRCSTIMGCINHFPNRSVISRLLFMLLTPGTTLLVYVMSRKLIYKPMKSIAVVREPIAR
jgi:hypothetical protein